MNDEAIARCQGRILDEVCSVRDTCAHYLSASTTYLLPTRVGWLCTSHKTIGDAAGVLRVTGLGTGTFVGKERGSSPALSRLEQTA